MSVRILQGDARDVLPTLPDNSVHTCVTSPPYYALRSYLDAAHPDKHRELGSEATPDEYLATMVAVFREVKRVLRTDGTLWLNMSGGYQNKQLDMMPARLALALQAPYYTGKIKSEADRIWLAAMIDTEGCMFIHKRKGGTPNYASYTKQDGTTTNYTRLQDTFGSGLEVANTSEAIVNRCLAIVGQGSICSQSPDQNNRRKQTIFRWNLRSNECREVVREIYPHLVAKQRQARILIGCPSAGEKAAAAHAAMIALHNGDPTDMDFPEPESMFEPGWFLRSDIIWSKLNPMPESVTDRPTSAYEHVFLLTKRATYFYDAEAVREEASVFLSTTGELSPRARYGGAFPQERADGACRPNGMGRSETPYQGGGTRNLRNVWTLPTSPYSEAHFATFPPALAERCIRAGTSERGCCAACGAPWRREVERTAMVIDRSERTHAMGRTRASGTMLEPPTVTTTGWSASCKCGADVVPATVLDPFAGAGTTLLVADRLQRNAIGIELNADYTRMAMERCRADAPLFVATPEPQPVPGLPPPDLFADLAAD